MVIGGLTGEALLLHGQHATCFLHLAVGAGAHLLDLALGGRTGLGRLLMCRKPDLVGLGLRSGDVALGLALRERTGALGVALNS